MKKYSKYFINIKFVEKQKMLCFEGENFIITINNFLSCFSAFNSKILKYYVRIKNSKHFKTKDKK